MKDLPVDYLNQDDLSLISLYREGDEEACTALLVRYASKINRRISQISLNGIENDDLRQEAYMGLYSAIRTYDPKKNDSFNAYASFCMSNSLKNLFRTVSTQKAKVNSQAVSLEEIGSDYLRSENSKNPEDIFIQNEASRNLKRLMSQILTPLEQEVLFSYFSGCGYREVAKKLNSSQKSVDNALQRARRKLKAVLNDL